MNSFTHKFKSWILEHPRQANLLENFGARKEDLIAVRITKPVISIGQADRLLRAAGIAPRAFLDSVMPRSVKYWDVRFRDKLKTIDKLPVSHPDVQAALKGNYLLSSDLERIASVVERQIADLVRYTEYESEVRTLGEIYVRKFPDNDKLTDETYFANDIVGDDGIAFLRKFQDWLMDNGCPVTEMSEKTGVEISHIFQDVVTDGNMARKLMAFAQWTDDDLRDVRRDSINFGNSLPLSLPEQFSRLRALGKGKVLKSILGIGYCRLVHFDTQRGCWAYHAGR